MSSATLKDIIGKLPPSERKALERLNDRVLSSTGDKVVFTADRLYDISQASSKASLNRILLELVSAGMLDSFVTVESVTGAGISEYESVTDIPDVVYDQHIGAHVNVTPDDVRVWFRRPRER